MHTGFQQTLPVDFSGRQVYRPNRLHSHKLTMENCDKDIMTAKECNSNHKFIATELHIKLSKPKLENRWFVQY